MPRQKRLSRKTQPPVPGHDGRATPTTRWIKRIALGLALVTLLACGRRLFSWSAEQMARHELSVGAVSTAQSWLARSAWFGPGSAAIDLSWAACFRHLGQMDRWQDAVRSAERKGVAPERIRQESQLGLIQLGLPKGGAAWDLSALSGGAVSPDDVESALVRGYLAREKPEMAKIVLDAWSADRPQAAQLAYMRGVYWRWMSEPGRAEEGFLQALAQQPRHELARVSLAQLFEEQDRLTAALEQHLEWVARFPANKAAQIGLARLLRKTGRLADARGVLTSLPSGVDAAVLVELGQIELEVGNCVQAESLFEKAKPAQSQDFEALSAAATLLAIRGETRDTEGMFARIDALQNKTTAAYDLQVRLTIDPTDTRVAQALQQLSSPAQPPAEQRSAPPAGAQTKRSNETRGAELYALHCAACHGADGDGKGRAARHLYPRPLNLQTGRNRLVSRLNGIPAEEDIEAVLRRGMPGTSMPAFDRLSREERKSLAGEVLRLKRAGIRVRFQEILTQEGEEITASDLESMVALHTTPGEVANVPQISGLEARAIAGGKQTYAGLGCRNCHGDDGTGTTDLRMFDEAGRPALARDLVHEPFKGGHELESVYHRLVCGMPGSPHPSNASLSGEQLLDLVQYCRSLSREPKRSLTNLERAVRATQRPLRTTPGESASP